MLRSFFIYMSKAGWARQIVTRWPIAWKAASRFITGEKLSDGIQVIKALNEKGIQATLDHLGEHTTNPEESRRATRDILNMCQAIEEAGVRANISIKLSQIGVAVDEELCVQNLRSILECANQHGIFVRIDMEDVPWVDTTFRVYRRMRDEFGFANSGLVIQSYLYRSEADVSQLVKEHTRIRLCKGAYKESAEVAFPRKADVDVNYDRLAAIMMDGALAAGSPPASPDGRMPPLPVIASHDPKRLAFAKAYAQKVGLPKNAIEFQMLYGIRRDLQEQTAREGYPVRVYVPFGTEWYPYYVRRLAERPANVWFFVSNYFRK